MSFLFGLFLLVAAVNGQITGACPGKFRGEPCLLNATESTNGQTDGACDERPRPCPSATNCEPDWVCSPSRARLRADCVATGDLCLIPATETTLAATSTCIAGCPQAEPNCAVAFHCKLPVQTSTTTATGQPGPTIVLPDPNRAAACRDKSDGAKCSINGKSGACTFGRPKAKRVPLQLECFEASDSSSAVVHSLSSLLIAVVMVVATL